MSGASQSPPAVPDIARDIFLWRRKKLSVAIPFIATATWAALELYQFNFITVVSWVVMFVVTSMFLWGNVLRLLGKEAPHLSGLEITEQSAVEIANFGREWSEEVVRWMFLLGAESEWFVFAKTVAGLLLLSLIGSFIDLLTLLYTGILVGMTVPVIYVKYEEKIKTCWERMKAQWRRFCEMVDEKVFKKLKKKVVQQKKEKKVE